MSYLISLVVGASIFIADRITKYLALQYCMNQCVINSVLSFEVGFNRGITWGFLYSESSTVFSLVTAVIIIVTGAVVWYASLRHRMGYSILGEAFIIAGSVSNIMDRFWYGGVVDFIEFSYRQWVWPSFNIADMFIVMGVLVMLYQHTQEEE